MILTRNQIDEIVNYLQGSCHTVDDAIYAVTDGQLETIEEITNWQELFDILESQHFLCTRCGWWSEAGYYAEYVEEENVCADCDDD